MMIEKVRRYGFGKSMTAMPRSFQPMTRRIDIVARLDRRDAICTGGYAIDQGVLNVIRWKSRTR